MPRNSRRRGDTYTLKISHKDAYGTYDLAVLMQPPAQSFAVSLPASISNGVPLAGAGDLETTASEDDYTFTTGAQGTLQMAFSGCPGGQVYWTLTNTDTNGRVGSGWTCATITEQNLQGHTGTYSLGLVMQPPAQSFAVSLPASISNGVPLAGAGDLETTASEDDYTFTTGAQGTLQMVFSGCPGGQVYWTLTNTDTNGRVGSGWTCATITKQNLPAADYKLAITDQGHSGPYQLTITTS